MKGSKKMQAITGSFKLVKLRFLVIEVDGINYTVFARNYNFSFAQDSTKFINFLILSSSEVKFGKSFPYKKSSPALAIKSLVLLFDKLLHPIARNKNSSI